MTDHYDLASVEFERHGEDSETSKLAHFYAAGAYERRALLFMQIPPTVLAVILTCLLTSDLNKFFDPNMVKILKEPVPVVLGLLIAIWSAVGAVLNYNQLAERHRTAAQKYQTLTRRCKNWKTDFPDESFATGARAEAKQCRDRLSEINAESPQIPKWAWKSVKKQREEGSTAYKADQSTTR
jgi:hypothetical protein